LVSKICSISESDSVLTSSTTSARTIPLLFLLGYVAYASIFRYKKKKKYENWKRRGGKERGGKEEEKRRERGGKEEEKREEIICCG
jgi:hypothetical protein